MKKIMIMIVITIIFFALSGCNSYRNQRDLALDKNWGRSYEAIKFAQIINPDAGSIVVEDKGMNAIAVQYNHDKYQKDFIKLDAPTADTDISTGGNQNGNQSSN